MEYLRWIIILFAAGVGLACRLCVLGPTALAFKGSLFMEPHSKSIIMQQLLVTACPSVCGLCVSLTVSVQRHACLLASTRWPSYIIPIIVQSLVQRWDHSPSKYTCLRSDLFFHRCERPSGFISCCTALQCHVCSHYPDPARENMWGAAWQSHCDRKWPSFDPKVLLFSLVDKDQALTCKQMMKLWHGK